MKKLCKFIRSNIKVVVAFVIGLALAGTGVYAAVASSTIGYDNSSSGLSATDVQSAIDELNTKATTKIEAARKECPDGKVCSTAVCKRAIELHKETCSNNCTSDGYASGDIIEYGNLGTNGILTTGDAFDCDVNGDGTYDATKERFYYVTDMNEYTAVLIYYSNVSSGTPSNTTSGYSSSQTNFSGPTTAKNQLPSTTTWKNVSLSNSIRAITNENGGTTTGSGTLPTDFSYEGRAARLITYQEINAGCYDGTKAINSSGGLSSKCKFLFENTKYANSSTKPYGSWLETPNSSSNGTVWSVYGNSRYIATNNANNTSYIGVRPTIEVLKFNISY